MMDAETTIKNVMAICLCAVASVMGACFLMYLLAETWEYWMDKRYQWKKKHMQKVEEMEEEFLRIQQRMKQYSQSMTEK